MASQKYNGQEIAIGQWVNLDTLMKVGFAGKPARVVEVRPKSIVAEASHKLKDGTVEHDKPRLARKSNITFVSDSFDDADAIREAGRKFSDGEFEIERANKRATEQRKKDAIEKVLNSLMYPY